MPPPHPRERPAWQWPGRCPSARLAPATAASPRRPPRRAFPRAGSLCVPLEQAAGDDETLDLVGALADDHQRRVAVVALDGQLGGVAVAAVHAHGLGGALERRLRREQLGHARLDVAALTRLLLAGRA